MENHTEESQKTLLGRWSKALSKKVQGLEILLACYGISVRNPKVQCKLDVIIVLDYTCGNKFKIVKKLMSTKRYEWNYEMSYEVYYNQVHIHLTTAHIWLIVSVN